MKMSENIRRKGFTLIELLILLVIVGVLGGAMTLMNRDAEASTRAGHIIRDFRNLKTAASLWHEDRQGKLNGGTHDRTEIVEYLSSRTYVNLSDEEGGYMLRVTDNGKCWYVGRELSEDSRMRGKLTAKAEDVNLLGSDMKTTYNNDAQVWVKVLTIEG